MEMMKIPRKPSRIWVFHVKKSLILWTNCGVSANPSRVEIPPASLSRVIEAVQVGPGRTRVVAVTRDVEKAEVYDRMVASETTATLMT